MAMPSGRWSRSKCLFCDFDKATFRGTANAHSNGCSVNVSITSQLYAAEDKQRGSIDDPLDQLRKVVANGWSWLWLDDWLEDDIAVEICYVLSGPAIEVYEGSDHFGLIAECVGHLIA